MHDKDLAKLNVCFVGMGLAGVAVAAATYYFLVYLPLVERAEHWTAETARYKSLLAKAAVIQEQYQHLQTSRNEVERRNEALRSRIPTRANEAEFLRQLTNSAQAAGFVLQDYRRGSVTKKESFSELEVRILGEGGYRAICGFLDRLEKLPRAYRLGKLRISKPRDGEIYPLDMTLSLYYGLLGAEPDGDHG